MSDCKCLNVNDVLNNLANRVALDSMAKIDMLSESEYDAARKTLCDVLWQIHWYREEMDRLQKEVRGEQS